MGKERDEWDRNAALQQTLLSTGLSRPKRVPKLDELNPIRNAETEDEEWTDDFEAKIEQALQQ